MAVVLFLFQKEPMDHPELKALLDPIQQLYEDVKRKAVMRLQFEGLEKSDQVKDPSSPYYNNPVKFAMDRYCYYPCYKCKKVCEKELGIILVRK